MDGKWLRELRILTVARFVALAARVVAVLFLALGTWAQITDPSAWPPGARTLATIHAHPFLLFVMVLLTAMATFDLAEFIDRIDRKKTNSLAHIRMVAGVENMRGGISRRAKFDFRRAIENLLMAGKMEIEQQFNLEGQHKIELNLLWLGECALTVIVAARTGTADVPVEYAWNDLRASCHAMKTNRTAVECHICQNPRLNLGSKPYNCVAAVPISYRDRAWGVITVDSKDGDTFEGKEIVVDRILRPIATMIMLTRSDDDPFVSCPLHDHR